MHIAPQVQADIALVRRHQHVCTISQSKSQDVFSVLEEEDIIGQEHMRPAGHGAGVTGRVNATLRHRTNNEGNEDSQHKGHQIPEECLT